MRHFSNWIEAYLEHTTISEAPGLAHFWCAVWTVAGALKRNVWYRAGHFDWTPNVYVILVGPPGVIQKSTTARVGARILEQVPGVVFGPDSATWHGLLPKFVSAQHELEAPAGRFQVSPLSIASDELGSFLKLSQEGLESVLIDMWDGQLRSRPWVHTTQTNGDKEVWNGLLNFLGCTTLGWVRGSIPASALESGFISRILFVYGDQKRNLVAVPKLDSRWNASGDRDRERRLVDDLRRIALLRGPMELAVSAAEWMQSWYARHWSGGRPEHMASERYDVYRSRKQSHVMKLALVLTAAKGDSMEISRQTLEEALGAVEAAESSVVRVFETVGGPPEAQHVREILGLVEGVWKATGEPILLTEAFRRLRNVMTLEDFRGAVRSGIEAGILRARTPGSASSTILLPGESKP